MNWVGEMGGWNTEPHLFSVNANVCLNFLFFIPPLKLIDRDRENLRPKIGPFTLSLQNNFSISGQEKSLDEMRAQRGSATRYTLFTSARAFFSAPRL